MQTTAKAFSSNFKAHNHRVPLDIHHMQIHYAGSLPLDLFKVKGDGTYSYHNAFKGQTQLLYVITLL